MEGVWLMRMRAWCLATAACCACSSGLPRGSSSPSGAPATPPGAVGVNVEDIKWRPSTLYPGVQVGDLEGGVEAGPYTLRGRFPAGAIERPHWHPTIGHVTVLAGVVHFGLGNHFDSAATKAYRAGAFFIVPANVPHYLWMEGETTIQNHGQGPYEVVFVDPQDDPRKR
jgi:hypothetical protein